MYVDKAIALIWFLNCCSLARFQSAKKPGEFVNYVTILKINFSLIELSIR